MHPIIRVIHSIGQSSERIVGENHWPGLAARHLGMVGLTAGGAGYDMQRPRPDSGHILVCHGGNGQIWINGEWRPCGTGQAYIAPPLKPMGFRTQGRHPWQFAWAFLPVIPGDPPPVASFHPVQAAVDPRPIVNAIEGLYLELTAQARPDRLELWGDLIAAYVRELATGGAEVDPLWPLWAEVDARLAEPWNLERLADIARMGTETLRRVSLRTMGRSPIQQVTYLRMRRAEALLRSTGSKLSHIAQQVGYGNTFAFSTAFRRWKGQPPKQCRGVR